jgi:hypothetical protein
MGRYRIANAIWRKGGRMLLRVKKSLRKGLTQEKKGRHRSHEKNGVNRVPPRVEEGGVFQE